MFFWRCISWLAKLGVARSLNTFAVIFVTGHPPPPKTTTEWNRSNRIDGLLRKTFRRGFCCKTFSIDELISAVDNKYFGKYQVRGTAYVYCLPNTDNVIPTYRSRCAQPQIESTLCKTAFLTDACFLTFQCVPYVPLLHVFFYF